MASTAAQETRPPVTMACDAGSSVVTVDARTPEGRAIMREAFGLSPLRRAEIRRSFIVSETDRAHPLFGGIFAGLKVVPDAEAAALDAEIAALKAPAQREAA